MKGQSASLWRGFNPKEFGRRLGLRPLANGRNGGCCVGLSTGLTKAGAAGGFPRKRDEKPFVRTARTVQAGSVWHGHIDY